MHVASCESSVNEAVTEGDFKKVPGTTLPKVIN